MNLDESALDDLLNTPEGPVGLVVGELSEKAARIAEAVAPVMKARNHWGHGSFSPLHQYGPPGETKRSVHTSGFRYNGLGQMYNGVNVNYGPTLFLQRPARQIRSAQYRFMSEALDAVEL